MASDNVRSAIFVVVVVVVVFVVVMVVLQTYIDYTAR